MGTQYKWRPSDQYSAQHNQEQGGLTEARQGWEE